MARREKTHSRAGDQTQISISLSRKLLGEVDEAAQDDRRSRSNWIVLQLEAAVAARKKLASEASAQGGNAVSSRLTYPSAEEEQGPRLLAAEEEPAPRSVKPGAPAKPRS